MKIYISLPISGRPLEDARERARAAHRAIWHRRHTAVNPLEVAAPYSTYAAKIGADIAALLECDAILMTEGWMNSYGCNLELAAAELYGKLVYYDAMEIPRGGTPEVERALSRVPRIEEVSPAEMVKTMERKSIERGLEAAAELGSKLGPSDCC